MPYIPNAAATAQYQQLVATEARAQRAEQRLQEFVTANPELTKPNYGTASRTVREQFWALRDLRDMAREDNSAVRRGAAAR